MALLFYCTGFIGLYIILAVSRVYRRSRGESDPSSSYLHGFEQRRERFCNQHLQAAKMQSLLAALLVFSTAANAQKMTADIVSCPG